MKNVGFDGGSFLCELGPSADVVAFFSCLRQYAAQYRPNTDYGLLTDRLYRRYLKLEELDKASALMAQVRDDFTQVPSAEVDWNSVGRDEMHTRLNINASTLADVFVKYFEHFARCVESAQVFFESWKIYQPVKTVISDMPEFMTDKKRPLEQYETLEGKPFWLR